MKNNLNFRMLNFISNFPLHQLPDGFESLALLPCRKCKLDTSIPENILMACHGKCGQTFHQKCYGLVIPKDQKFYCRKDSCQQVRVAVEAELQTQQKKKKKSSSLSSLSANRRDSTHQAKPSKPNSQDLRNRRHLSSSTIEVVEPLPLDLSPSGRRDSVPIVPQLRTCFDAYLYLERYFDPFLLGICLPFLDSKLTNDGPAFDVPALGEKDTVDGNSNQDTIIPEPLQTIELTPIPEKETLVAEIADLAGNDQSSSISIDQPDKSAELKNDLGDEKEMPSKPGNDEVATTPEYDASTQLCRKSFLLSLNFDETASVNYQSDRKQSQWQDDILSGSPFFAMRMVNVEYGINIGILNAETAKWNLADEEYDYFFPPSPYSGIFGRFLDSKCILKDAEYYENKSLLEINDRAGYSAEVEVLDSKVLETEDSSEIVSELWLLRKELEIASRINNQRKAKLLSKIPNVADLCQAVKEKRDLKVEAVKGYIELAKESPWCKKSSEDLDIIFDCYTSSRAKLYSQSCNLEEEKAPKPPSRRASTTSTHVKSHSSSHRNSISKSQDQQNLEDFREVSQTTLKDIYLRTHEIISCLENENFDTKEDAIMSDDDNFAHISKIITPHRRLKYRLDDIEVNVFCVCQSDTLSSDFYLSCHFCETWYHGDCVNILHSNELVDRFICQFCELETGFKTTFLKSAGDARRETRSTSTRPRSLHSNAERCILAPMNAKFIFDGNVIAKKFGYRPILQKLDSNISTPLIQQPRRNSASSSSTPLPKRHRRISKSSLSPSPLKLILRIPTPSDSKENQIVNSSPIPLPQSPLPPLSKNLRRSSKRRFTTSSDDDDYIEDGLYPSRRAPKRTRSIHLDQQQ
jgi:hypothetical protein